MTKTSKFITVFIPVFNGDKYLRELIDIVLAQQLPKGYKLELLVIDSGSSDSSVEILRGYGDAITLIQIPNSEFGHGKTRQRAAEIAKGEFILFTTQDATPTHHRWLINMIEPFFLDKKIGCVFGRQVPRPTAIPSIKREVKTVFDNFGLTESIVIARHKSLVDGKEQTPIDSFFSDVNSAIRKDLNKKIPFRDLPYAEDQALAKDIQEAGYFKAYAPQGSVWHSNEYDIISFRKRKFDEFIGLQDSVNYSEKASIIKLIYYSTRETWTDFIFILKDHDYSLKRKLFYLLQNPFYNFMGQLGKYEALKYFKDDEKRQKKSYEAGWRNK